MFEVQVFAEEITLIAGDYSASRIQDADFTQQEEPF
jgi:hypothetical protein